VLMEDATATEQTELKVPSTLKALVEGLVFAAKEPLSARQIKAIYEGDPREATGRTIDPATIRTIVDELNQEYIKGDRPYRILTIAGGYQFATLPEYAEWLGKLYKEQARRRLSQSGVETLAIIAYKQPITKSEIEKIRGVNCDYVLKTLLEKDLVTITGRAETVGRPLLYGTTREFLKHFGLSDVTDLPRPREIEEILGESQFETERRMLEAQAGAEQMKKEADEFRSRLPHIPKKKAELGKEVEIVPRKRSREIRIVQSREQRALEEAGQERIEFVAPVADTSAPAPPVDTVEQLTEPPVHENIEVPASDSLPEREQVPEPSADPAVESSTSPEMPEIGQQESGVDAAMSVAAAEAVPDTPAPLEVKESSATEALGSHGAADGPRTRWRSWKEKIQGFIRKLFG